MGQLRVSPREEGEYLLGFSLSRAHLLLAEIYEDHLHHSNGTHLDRGMADDSLLQSFRLRIAAHSSIWYTMPPVVVWCRFMSILVEE